MDQTSNGNILRRPLVSILITLFIIFTVGFQFFGVFLGGLIAYPFFPGSPTEYVNAFQNVTAYPSFKLSLLVTQGVAATFGMIVLPYYFLRAQQRSLKELFKVPHLQPSLVILILVIVFMGVNSFFIDWNQKIHLPFGLEELARPIEDSLQAATKFITQYDSYGQFILAFVVIAVIPGVGEEIIFRGMIQNDFYRATKNIHVAIWMSALMFSAIHFQFYGFVPRLFLGALFGYLYVWSGNLWMPVLAHFINNAFSVVAFLLYQRQAISIDLEAVQPSMAQVMFSAAFSIFLLYAYKNFFNKIPKHDIPD